MVLRVTVLDGYSDEPAGLGVPPYLDVYPRYAAGAIWSVEKDALIKYYTIDRARENWTAFCKDANSSNITIVLAGTIVPGKYLAATPITPEEIINVGMSLTSTLSILAGPVARFGMGRGGGSPVVGPHTLGRHYDVVVKGDIDAFLRSMLLEGLEKADPLVKRESYSDAERSLIYGARIVLQHPNYGYNLTLELETYRGCTRWFTGGCSFCVEPSYAMPVQRDKRDIIREAETLYELGVRAFRVGRQSDILTYGSPKLGVEEAPQPNPEELELLFRGLRAAVRESTLHIDNVNPAVIARNEKAAIRALEAIVKYHTPGDVAAMGIESADERVVRMNNLNATPEDSLKAIEIVNKVGRHVGWNGLPHLLPGVNFVLGLLGETKETFRRNIEFLETLLKRNLLVRRINIRRVLVLPGTRLYTSWNRRILSKHEKYIKHFIWIVRHKFDPEFLKRVAPKGRVLRCLFVEKTGGNITYARQTGSYPLVAELPGKLPKPCVLDAIVVGHKGRSVKAIPTGVCKSPLECTPIAASA
uniref:Radical SAM protein n=1 Tax=Fervidicoccus fontis TaxID=683846 RepID=A0A7J3ZM13_9CREN